VPLNDPPVPQADSKVRDINPRITLRALPRPVRRDRRRIHNAQAATTTYGPSAGKRFHGLSRIGSNSPTGTEDNCSESCGFPELITGLGLKVQLTPVGRDAGAQLNNSASPGIPVPAVTDIGMLTDPPEGNVLFAGTTTVGGVNIVTCVVVELKWLPCDVAVMVTFGGTGGGFGAVNSPASFIVPADAVQVTG